WIEWHAEHKDKNNNLHLTRAELEKVRVVSGERDAEYAAVVNSVFPFENCVAHLAQEWWGSQGCGYSDLQMRVYVVEMSPEEIQQKVLTAGFETASKVHKSRPNSVLVRQTQYEQWSRVVINYELLFSDYNDYARVDVFVQAF